MVQGRGPTLRAPVPGPRRWVATAAAGCASPGKPPSLLPPREALGPTKPFLGRVARKERDRASPPHSPQAKPEIRTSRRPLSWDLSLPWPVFQSKSGSQRSGRQGQGQLAGAGTETVVTWPRGTAEVGPGRPACLQKSLSPPPLWGTHPSYILLPSRDPPPGGGRPRGWAAEESREVGSRLRASRDCISNQSLRTNGKTLFPLWGRRPLPSG